MIEYKLQKRTIMLGSKLLNFLLVNETVNKFTASKALVSYTR